MIRILRGLLGLSCLIAVFSSGASACVYPTPLITVTGVLRGILDDGGSVRVHHRRALDRSLLELDSPSLKATLNATVPRRDARAASAVIDVAQALAAGRGLTLDPDLRDPVTRLSDAVQAKCATQANVAEGTDQAEGAEHGHAPEPGPGGEAFDLREGVARLSLTFTLYMAFLAFLLGARRAWKTRTRPEKGGATAKSAATS